MYTKDTSKVDRKTSGEFAERTEVREHKRNPKFDEANLEVSKVYNKLCDVQDTLSENPLSVSIAHNRIRKYLYLTPILHSSLLNQELGHEIYFKADCLQKTGAFKVRGALNHLLSLEEQGILPSKVVCYSTGNHGIGLAFVGQLLQIQTRVYLPYDTSDTKKDAIRSYNAEVICINTRQEAEDQAYSDQKLGFYYLHPSDSDTTIAGAGTMCFEALNQLEFKPDAIFASCGGGGLLSGTYLAKELLSPHSLLIGTEPEMANDAFLSLQKKSIYRFSKSPNTIADGLRALSLSKRTFNYIQKLDDLFLASEKDILYWTQKLNKLLNVPCEPSCAINMSSAVKWLQSKEKACKILIMLSGGNINLS